MKVRIAVAVNSVGGWAALGAYGMLDDQAGSTVIRSVTENGTGAALISWVEADVPAPVRPTPIQGKVVP